MGLMGQIMGGTIGFALAGPLGAILGIVLGSGIRGGVATGLGSQQRSQAAYFVATFSMLGKIAKADGVVSDKEVQLVQDYMRQGLRMDSQTQEFAMKIFHTAASSTTPFEEFATQFYGLFSGRPEILRSMLDLLTRLSMADGVLSPGEEQLLKSAVRIFHLSNDEYRHVKEQYSPDTDKYYAILGCDRNASMEEIKSKYRKLAGDFHPDKIVSKGLPDEFTRFATEKFQEIQHAYQEIQKEKKN